MAIGAAAGAFSHIVLDSVMHSDFTPFSPFSDANPLFRLTSLPALHWFSLGSGALALLILGIRKVMVSHDAR